LEVSQPQFPRPHRPKTLETAGNEADPSAPKWMEFGRRVGTPSRIHGFYRKQGCNNLSFIGQAGLS
jgi:hypothetical protein